MKKQKPKRKYQKTTLEISNFNARRRVKFNGKRMIKFFTAILRAYEAIPNKEERKRIHAAVGIICEL